MTGGRDATTGTGATLRPLEPGDAPAAAALDVSGAPAAWWAEVPTRRGHHALVLDLPHAPAVGVALAVVVLDEAEVHTIAVDPAHRRRGLGAHLLTGLLDDLDRVGVRSVHLEVGRDNLAARALYAGHGFAVVGERPGYYAGGADALLLRRGPAVPEGPPDR
ncbi:MAG: GNAT family N-acetyltransferase [Actinomycetes bacterium]